MPPDVDQLRTCEYVRPWDTYIGGKLFLEREGNQREGKRESGSVTLKETWVLNDVRGILAFWMLPLLVVVIPAYAQLPVITAVVNSATLGGCCPVARAPTIAAGSWITIGGTNLSATTRAWGGSDFVNNKLPTSLDGVSVKVNNKNAAIAYISPDQLNVLSPLDDTTGFVSVTVTNPRGTSSAASVSLQSFSPEFFTFAPVNTRYAAAVHLDGTLVGKVTLFCAPVATSPAVPGETILVFGTGFGATIPPINTEDVFQGAAVLAAQPTIWIGTSQAKILFAGLSSNGLYQFNVTVPDDVAAGDQPIAVSVGGVTSESYLSVQPTAPAPQTTSVEPAVVYPDRLYTSVSSNFSRPTGQFLIHGSDLASVQSAEVLPSDGIALTLAFPLDFVLTTATTPGALCYNPRQTDSVQGLLKVDAIAPPGIRRLHVTSRDGTSNDVTFEVRQAPSTAPVISNVSLEVPTIGPSSVTWRGHLSFTDSDGDIRNTGVAVGELAFIRLTVLSGDAGVGVQTIDIPNGFANQDGKTSGNIDFSFTNRSVNNVRRYTSATPIAVTLFDAAGNPSNSVRVSVPTWILPVI